MGTAKTVDHPTWPGVNFLVIGEKVESNCTTTSILL